MASPTPSLDSLTRTHSVGSFGDHTDFLSFSPLADSPLTLSDNSSPPFSDSAIGDCREYLTSSSSSSSTSSASIINNTAITTTSALTSVTNGGSLHTQTSTTPNATELICLFCRQILLKPKVLPCFHSFCQTCIDKNQTHPDKLTCPICHNDCLINEIASEFTNELKQIILRLNSDPKFTAARCTGCKSKKSDAVARCIDCANYLCLNCVMAHQFMHCFEGHRVLNLGGSNESNNQKDENNKPNNLVITNGSGNNGLGSNDEKAVYCPRHKVEILKYYCRTCTTPICKECTMLEHPSGLHEWEHLNEAVPKQLEVMNQIIQEAKGKATDMLNMVKNVEHSSSRLQVQYHKAQNEINDTFQFYRSMLEERKQELLKELESVFSAKQISLGVVTQKGKETVEKIYQTCDFAERLTKCASAVELLMFRKLLDTKLNGLLNYNPEQNVQTACELEFVSNYQAIQVGVRNTFGYVRSSSEVNLGPSKQPPIARPTNGSLLNGCSSTSSSGSSMNGSSNSINGGIHGLSSLNNVLDRPFSNGLVSSSSQSTSPFESNIISKRFSSANSLGPFSATIGDMNLNGINPYEKWSNGGTESMFQNGTSEHFSLASTTVHADSMLDLTSKLMSTAIFPPKSQIKRQKMIYHCKFGEFGVMEGQFTEPSGVAVNAQNDIIVADTNNHRIQIFDKEGRFKFQFGECGKRDGQLLYPNRVAVVRTSGDIIVTERSPTHQIQIYNQYGQFVRKFGANILQHPRGVTVDNKGRIVVVECKVMRVIIFDQTGGVIQKFGCSKHLEFPNGVVVNDKQEIFISDNRAHCVKVFNYEGTYLRQIGGEGITNYPIGVGINAAGEILIADNHNNFNLTIFTQDGQLVSALESKVKHAQCFDVALMDDGSVVLASKDYRLYIYRYVQVPPLGL